MIDVGSSTHRCAGMIIEEYYIGIKGSKGSKGGSKRKGNINDNICCLIKIFFM